MPLLPQPGEFQTTGLPEHLDIFSAWLFLRTNNDAQPENYRYGFSQELALRLLGFGEHRPQVLAAALLAVMPLELNGMLRQRLGAEYADTAKSFVHHMMTRYAYIGTATPEVKKMTMVMLCKTMQEMQKNGEGMLAQMDALQNQHHEGDLTVPLLPDDRSFMLVYDKICGTTDNRHLENAYLTAALAYKAFREDYLYQLSLFHILPAQARRALAAEVAEAPPIPQFDRTMITDTPELRALYAQLAMDARVKPATLIQATTIAEILSRSGECAPVTVAAALLSKCLPDLNLQDTLFLRPIVGTDVFYVLDDNLTATRTKIPFQNAPLPLRHIDTASAIAQLRLAEHTATRTFEHLRLYAKQLSDAEKRNLASQVAQRVGGPLHVIVSSLQPVTGSMQAPVLARMLDDQVSNTYTALMRLRAFVTPAPDTKPAHGTQPSGPSAQ